MTKLNMHEWENNLIAGVLHPGQKYEEFTAIHTKDCLHGICPKCSEEYDCCGNNVMIRCKCGTYIFWAGSLNLYSDQPFRARYLKSKSLGPSDSKPGELQGGLLQMAGVFEIMNGKISDLESRARDMDAANAALERRFEKLLDEVARLSVDPILPGNCDVYNINRRIEMLAEKVAILGSKPRTIWEWLKGVYHDSI